MAKFPAVKFEGVSAGVLVELFGLKLLFYIECASLGMKVKFECVCG